MYNTHARRVVTGLALALPVLGLAGCPMPGTTTPTPIFTGTNAYTGQILEFGKAYPGATSIQLRFPTNSTSGIRSAAITTDASGDFMVPTATATESSYQFVWDLGGATASATTASFGDLVVTDPITKPVVGKDNVTPGFTIETGWHLDPGVGVNATMSVTNGATFSFSTFSPQGAPAAAGPFEYQVFLQDAAGDQWSSATHAFGTTASSASIAWNGLIGANSDSPSGAAFPTGAAAYMIKWETQGVTDGSKAFGQSLWIPVTLQ